MDVGELYMAIKDVRLSKPILFVSYDTDELALADFIKGVLLRWTEERLEVFVAKRDIRAGDNPYKEMMDRALKNAAAIIPICSIKSKTSPWLWWESASVWARDKKVYPLFTNILPGHFGGPLILVSQGKSFFEKKEFIETLKNVCNELSIKSLSESLDLEEEKDYEKLVRTYSQAKTSAVISATYQKLKIVPDHHEYSFILAIKNETEKKFEDVIVELDFPIDYIEVKEWGYPHLRSTVLGNAGYLRLVFNYSALAEPAKGIFGTGLLPGRVLKVFGEDHEALTKLRYEMDDSRWDRRFTYEVRWNVYINGGAPIEGRIPLDSLQCY